MSEYNICSLLVHIKLDKINQIDKNLRQQVGVEVHANTDDGRLLVTVEADNRKEVAQQIMDIQNINGVYSAAMIYQFSDDLKDEDSNTLKQARI